MFKLGDVVYHDDLVFNDDCEDIKGFRPCIVLFTTLDEVGNYYVCSCPLTSSIKSFNKHPDKYTLLTETINNSKKLSFAKLLDICYMPFEKTYHTGSYISQKEVKRLLNLFNNKIVENKYNVKTDYTIKQSLKYLDYVLEQEYNQKVLKK